MQITNNHASCTDRHVFLDESGALISYPEGIKRLKTLLGVRNKRLAELTGYGKRAVDAWTRGFCQPSPSALIIMERLLSDHESAITTQETSLSQIVDSHAAACNAQPIAKEVVTQ